MDKENQEVASPRDRVISALLQAVRSAGIEIEKDSIDLERPNDMANGDLSSNIALVTRGGGKGNPRELAFEIVEKIDLSPDFIDRVEVAGPGFINFSFSRRYLLDQIAGINREKGDYGNLPVGRGKKIQIEFVSANPTGPLVLVSARAAAVGASLVNLYRKAGYEVDAEYYVNDTGSQVEKLGISLMARYRQRMGEDIPFPAEGYPGDYLLDIAGQVPAEEAGEWLGLEEREAAERFGAFALEKIIETIKTDLDFFEVRFDRFFRESDMHRPDGEVKEALRIMENEDMVYQKEGARWFRSTEYGDEKDRVVIRSDNTPTYFLADAAYHLNKLRRGYDEVIDIFGPDHHGHVKRLQAASAVFGAAEDWLKVLTVQWVRLIEDGKQVSMSKRTGEYITLRELVSDVGRDAAKFFFLMRKNNAHMDFDLSLARKQSDENPVYYVQYAHARIRSVISFAREKDVEFPDSFECLDSLREPEEIGLIRELIIFPQLVEGAVLTNDANRLTTYAQEIASSFHHFYHICRIVSSDGRLSQARLLLAEATRIILAESLRLIGVTAPERM